ncbi:iron-sulfur cluster assembly accessory protein [Candidatus Pacearchaeota archaeon]|nr:iron-sulfur cluster assembly accessory protein [Candidatus Pacearchaeota archaeon]
MDEKPAIILTKAAAEAVKQIIEKSGLGGKVLKVFVKAGGCSGLEYGIEMIDEADAEHKKLLSEQHGIKVYTDKKSYLYLNGMELDYSFDMNDSGFKFKNPQAQKTCGCGQSFSA